MTEPSERPASTPGAPGWAAAIQALRDTEPTPRRAALFRVADGVRSVLHRMVQTSAPNDVIEAAAAEVEAAAARFEGYESKSMYEGFAEAANAGAPFGFFDHSPMLGRANPLAPPKNQRHCVQGSASCSSRTLRSGRARPTCWSRSAPRAPFPPQAGSWA